MVVLEQLKSASICRIFFSFKLIASSFSSSSFLFFFFPLISHRGKEEVEVSSAGRNAVKDNPQGIATRQGAY